MRVLYIDTSSSYLYSAIVDGDRLVDSISEDFGKSLSEVALPKIVSMFENNNISARDIDKIIVVNGPGSFTGIRVGLTIAKVYAWSLSIPITTITSLEAMACSVDSNKLLVPIIDARRGYVYASIYENNEELLEPQHILLDDLYNKIDKDSVFITNDEIELNGNKCEYVPNFVKIVKKYVEKNSINPHSVNPTYLKLTAAEENKKNDTRVNS